MDISERTVKTDALGRRSGPRRRRSQEEKRRIVQETMQPGASVSMVARRHELNANVVFRWRRLYQRKASEPASRAAPLIPVRIVEEKNAAAAVPSRPGRAAETDAIDIQLTDGTHVRVKGELAHEALRQLIATVRAR